MLDWARLLAFITGTVDQERQYLAIENRTPKAQLNGRRLLLSDVERASLPEIGHRLGRNAPEDVATAVKPDTRLGGYRRLVACDRDGQLTQAYRSLRASLNSCATASARSAGPPFMGCRIVAISAAPVPLGTEPAR